MGILQYSNRYACSIYMPRIQTNRFMYTTHIGNIFVNKYLIFINRINIAFFLSQGNTKFLPDLEGETENGSVNGKDLSEVDDMLPRPPPRTSSSLPMSSPTPGDQAYIRLIESMF
jgi:hypothetical protein